MAASAVLTLDVLAPAGVTIDLNSGAASTTALDVTAAIGTTDTPTTGYQMKIWGDVDDTLDTANYRALEANAPWISYATSKAVRVSSGLATKTVNVKVRDTVGNETAALDTISLVSAPAVTAGSWTPATISKVATFNTATNSFTVDGAIDAWEARVVATAGDARGSGTLIPQTGGSTTQYAGVSITAGTTITVTVKGPDLEAASAGSGGKLVKIFAKRASDQIWSV